MPKRSPNTLPKPKLINGTLLGCYVNRTRRTFGNYNDPRSWQRFVKFCADLCPGSVPVTTPDSLTGGVHAGIPAFNTLHCVTVGVLVEQFLDYAKEHKKSTYKDYWNGGSILVELFAGLPTEQFDSFCLLQVQEVWRSRNYVRGYANKLLHMTRAIFKWGEIRRLVPAGKFVHLQAVAVIPQGELPEGKVPPAVPFEEVEKTISFMSPLCREFIRMLLITPARPIELCRMQVGDIEKKTTDLWLYHPKHKTERFGKAKTIPFGKNEIAILSPLLIGKASKDYVFRQENGNPLNTGLVDKWVGQAIDRGNATLPLDEQIVRWTPYQIRHSFATMIRRELGNDDDAALLMGHTDGKMLRDRYDHGRGDRVIEMKKQLDKKRKPES